MQRDYFRNYRHVKYVVTVTRGEQGRESATCREEGDWREYRHVITDPRERIFVNELFKRKPDSIPGIDLDADDITDEDACGLVETPSVFTGRIAQLDRNRCSLALGDPAQQARRAEIEPLAKECLALGKKAASLERLVDALCAGRERMQRGGAIQEREPAPQNSQVEMDLPGFYQRLLARLNKFESALTRCCPTHYGRVRECERLAQACWDQEQQAARLERAIRTLCDPPPIVAPPPILTQSSVACFVLNTTPSM